MYQLLTLGGITVEVLGAIWLAHSAYQGHKGSKASIVKQLHWGLEDYERTDSLESRMSIALQEIAGEFEGIAREQWRAQAVGFVLLAAGLALQFVGALGV